MTDIVPTTGGARGAGLATFSDDGRVLDTWYLQPELGDPAGHRAPRRSRPAPSRTPRGSARTGWSAETRCATWWCRACTRPSPTCRRRPSTPTTCTCASTCCPTGSCGRTRSTSRASSGCCRRWRGRSSVRSRWTSSRPPGSGRARRGRPSWCGRSTSSHRCSTTWRRRGCASPTPVRVRLGAHLAEGTTVMHEGHVNFNAGTLGTAMVEGRITQGVVLGEGSDLGGGASILGTLSGGGKNVVRIGERCLIGANGGIGISLGDDCVVEAGLYVTAGTRVTLPDGQVVKAAELSGRVRVAVHPQQHHRRGGGPAPSGPHGGAQHRPAQLQLGGRLSARRCRGGSPWGRTPPGARPTTAGPTAASCRDPCRA